MCSQMVKLIFKEMIMLSKLSEYLSVVELYSSIEYKNKEPREFLRVTKANAYTLVYTFQNYLGKYEISVQETDNPNVIIINTSKIFIKEFGDWQYLCRI